MFYDSFIYLCEQKGVSPTKVLDSLAISRGSLFRWRNGGSPRNEYKKKIADYFGITTLELMNAKERELTMLDASGSKAFNEKGKELTIVSDDELSIDEKTLLTMYREIPKNQRAAALAGILNELKKISDK